jgi:hypothetical protein
MRALWALVSVTLALGCGARDAPPPSPPPTKPAPVAAPAKKEPHWLDQQLALARSETAEPLTRELPALVLTRRELRLLGADEFAIPLPAEASWAAGFPLSEKRSGPNDLFLVRLGGWLSETRQGDERDISVIVDRTIPYRLLMEALFTTGQSYSRFHFVVQSARGPREIVIEAPEGGQARPDVVLFIVKDGVAIKVPGGSVAPGCKDQGPGITIPRQGSELDSPALGRCLADLTHALPELEATGIAANPDTPFREIVATMDAARAFPALAAISLLVAR